MEKHQVKSRWYYAFWAVATVAVCSGQIYVGSGYREMATQQKAFAEAVYNQQMGWGSYQQQLESQANRKQNKTGEFE
jgi:hypothetical protein